MHNLKLMQRACVGVMALSLGLLGCKGNVFKGDSSTEKSKQNADSSAIVKDASSDQDESVALEPTAIGGAFLACFVDRQIPSEIIPGTGSTADQVPIGCSLFEDASYSRRAFKSEISLENAKIESTTDTKALTLLPVANHPRWSWLGLVPSGVQSKVLQVKVRVAQNEAITVRVDFLDLLPSGNASILNLFLGAFKIRLQGTSTCLHGDPNWSWDIENGKPVTQALATTDCNSAISFRFAPMLTGIRLMTVNPKPFSCDPTNFASEYCDNSCVDLENFGSGNRFVLFACTKSSEAQMHFFLPGAAGSIRMLVSKKFISFSDGLFVADSKVEDSQAFDLVTVAPSTL